MEGRTENGLLLMAGGQGSQLPSFLKGFEGHPLFKRAIEIAQDLGLGKQAMAEHNYVNLQKLATNNAEAGHLNDPDVNSYFNTLNNLILIWEFREKLKKADLVDECEPLGNWNFIRQDQNHKGKPFFQVASGISVGEVPAMVAAGMLSVEDALQIVAIRGKAMQEASLRNREDGQQGAMLPVTGKSVGEVEELLRECGDSLSIRNFNTVQADNGKNQLIVGGLKVEVEEVRAKLIAANPKLARILNLLQAGDAYHGSNMAPADAALFAALSAKNLSGDIHEPQLIVLDHQGRPQQVLASDDSNGIVRRFSNQVVSPIAPYKAIQAAGHAGVDQAIVFDGSKKITSGITKANGIPNIKVISSLADIAELDLGSLDEPGHFSFGAMANVIRARVKQMVHGK